MMSTLSSVAGCNPSLILIYITEMFEDIRKSGISTVFTSLRGISPMFKQDNKYHKQLFLNFMHLFIADLTCNILQNYGPVEGSKSIIMCGFKLCVENGDKQAMAKFLHPTILKQWSVIFSLISTVYSSEIIDQFLKQLTVGDSKDFFQLICYVRIDMENEKHREFIDSIVQILEKYIKSKKLTVRILMSISKLVSTAKMSPALNGLFDLVWKLRKDSEFKEGTFDLLASLFLRVPDQEKALKEFYRKRVYAHASNAKKVPRSMRLFQRLMYGTEVDIQWLSWNWSIDPPKSSLCFIHWNSQPKVSQEEKSSFTYYFMKYFFKESDFMSCSLVFCNTIVRLASLDFEYFKNNTFPKFLELDVNDPRFIVFLRATQLINSSDFVANAYKHVTKEQIADFNLKLKPKIINALTEVKPEKGVESISFFDLDPDMKMRMEAADQKISVLLHDWSMDIFRTVNLEYNQSSDSENEFTVSVQLVRTLSSVLTSSDFAQKKMINMCLRLSFHQDRRIASAALLICRNILTTPDLQLKFVEAILNHHQKPSSDESLFVCITLLLTVLERGNTNFKMSVYHDIELIGYIGFVSVHPSTRFISYKLLSSINDCLKERGSLTYIRENVLTMEAVVK